MWALSLSLLIFQLNCRNLILPGQMKRINQRLKRDLLNRLRRSMSTNFLILTQSTQRTSEAQVLSHQSPNNKISRHNYQRTLLYLHPSLSPHNNWTSIREYTKTLTKKKRDISDRSRLNKYSRKLAYPIKFWKKFGQWSILWTEG